MISIEPQGSRRREFYKPFLNNLRCLEELCNTQVQGPTLHYSLSKTMLWEQLRVRKWWPGSDVGTDVKPLQNLRVPYVQTVPIVKTKIHWKLSMARECHSALMSLNFTQEQKLWTPVFGTCSALRCTLWLPHLSWGHLIKTGGATVESGTGDLSQRLFNMWGEWILTPNQFAWDHYKVDKCLFTLLEREKQS